MGKRPLIKLFNSMSFEDKDRALNGLNVYKGDSILSLWDKQSLLSQPSNPRFKQWIDEHFSDNSVVMVVDDYKSGVSRQAIIACDDAMRNCKIVEKSEDYF